MLNKTQDEIYAEILESIVVVKKYSDALQRTNQTKRYIQCHELEMKLHQLLDVKKYSVNDYKVFLSIKIVDLSPSDFEDVIRPVGSIVKKDVINDKIQLKNMCISIVDNCKN